MHTLLQTVGRPRTAPEDAPARAPNFEPRRRTDNRVEAFGVITEVGTVRRLIE
jgi:hypothetical protein